MNPLDQLLQMLFQQAKPRPDVGVQQPVATFAGRVVNPGETTASVLKRMPMGSGEGDLSTALQATLGAVAQPAMSAASKAIAPKLLAMMVPAARVYHGSPVGFTQLDMSKNNPNSLVGPGHYVTDNPGLANDYALGSTSDAGALTRQGSYAPNVRSYQMNQHNALVTNKPVPQADLAAILQALQHTEFAPKTTKHGATVSPQQQSANITNQLESSVLPEVSPGQHLWDQLVSLLGPEAANGLLQKAGFQSIQYPGGRIMGDTLHQATNVLDPAILQNYADFAAGQR